ncbi:MAG: hypothetical protein JJE37_10900 [Methyloceanibacter sp.]|jgi:hypothetical protein|nr:hypothetical protein [Methyloceanibacter sp.]
MRGSIRVLVLGAAGLFQASLLQASLLPLLVGPAFADCQVVSATHGGHWQGEALSMSQALAARSANELKAQKKWRSISMKAYPVKPDPFFKTVRPEVSNNAIVGSFVTARTYTTCFTGITVPYVCTSGSQVCGN